MWKDKIKLEPKARVSLTLKAASNLTVLGKVKTQKYPDKSVLSFWAQKYFHHFIVH